MDFQGPEAALFLNRAAVGVFFAISGWHKLAVPARHAMLVDTFKALRIPFIGFNQWFVPAVELAGGVLLVVGAYSTIAALLLGAICLVALCTDGMRRVKEFQPIDVCDWCDDVLYLPETLFGIMLVVVILAGPGKWAVQ